MRSFKPLLTILLALLLGGCASSFPLPIPRQLPPTEIVPRTPTMRPSAAAALSSTTPTPGASATPGPTATYIRLGAKDRPDYFNVLWELINTTYAYSDFNGLDWSATRTKYAPLVEDASTNEFYALMTQMVAELDGGKSAYIPVQRAATSTASPATPTPTPTSFGGLGVAMVHRSQGLLIGHVIPAGPADRAGLRPGDLITAVNGTAYSDTTRLGYATFKELLRGEVGTTVKLQVVSPGKQPREVAVTRGAISTTPSPVFEARRLPASDVGLLSIYGFAEVTAIQAELLKLHAEKPLKGLIVDLRQTASDAFADFSTMQELAALFIGPGPAGTVKLRTKELAIELKGAALAELKDVRLVVLTGPVTQGRAEIFAALLRERRQAILVGQPTAGRPEIMALLPLPDGSELLMATGIYKLKDGQALDPKGLKPDLTVEGAPQPDLAEDEQLKAALDKLK